MSHHANVLRQQRDDLADVASTSFRLGLWLGGIVGFCGGAFVFTAIMMWGGK